MLAMLRTSAFLVWFAALAAAQVGGAAHNPSAAPAPPSTTKMTIAGIPWIAASGGDAMAPGGLIYVDQDCGLLPGPTVAATGKKKPSVYLDPAICHVEGNSRSQHREERPGAGELERSDVEVREKEYVLLNITMKRVAFVVMQPVAPGWVVDSDPQPNEVKDGTAYFRVYANPGETVRLHVGERHTKELKPKPIPPGGP